MTTFRPHFVLTTEERFDLGQAGCTSITVGENRTFTCLGVYGVRINEIIPTPTPMGN